MITKPYCGSSQPSAADDDVRQVNGAADELSVNCTSLFVYDHVDRQRTSDGYYDCAGDDRSRPIELLYPPSQPNSQLQLVPQQQQQQQHCPGDADEDDGVKLQLLAGCGSKVALEYPWMRDKKCASDGMCLSTSLSDHRLKQCLTSDPLTQAQGLSVSLFFCEFTQCTLNPLDSKGNYSAT